MTNTVTFIHAGDLHLGAPFRGLRALSPTWADRMLEAIPQAYDKVVQAAIDRNVDFVVFPGDVFDASAPSFPDFLHFFEGLRRLDDAGIPVYMCTGNHDPYTSWQNDFAELPKNTHLFPADKPGYFVYERQGTPMVLLGGRGYYSQSVHPETDIAAGITRAAAEKDCGVTTPFGVGVLHTGLHLDPTKAPTSPDTLLTSGMDYWALGHIHMPWRNSETNPQLVFSGCIQGRDVKETGPRGCYYVTLTEGAPNKAEFVPCASVVWQQIQVDISECSGLHDVNKKVMESLFRENGRAQCREMGARITLVGTTPLHAVLSVPGRLEEVRTSINNGYRDFFVDSLIDRTRIPINRDALEREGLFASTVIAQAEALRADTHKAQDYVEEACLAKGIPAPRIRLSDYDAISGHAEDLIIDLLSGDNR